MTNLIDTKFISDMWPSLKQMTYLNNASTGIQPVPTINAIKEYLDNSVEAIGSFQDTLNLFKEVRTNLAKLLGGDYSQYAFVPSTSSGINSFGHSIEYPAGSNIVLCDLEFPANYIPWQNISKLYGPELRVVKSTDGAVSLDDFAEMIDENTRVVAVSQIQFGSGFRIDLESLTKMTHDNGALLLVDIIQAAGCFDTDLSKLKVDFATGQAAKWLLGPIGAGFVYVSNSIMEKVQPRFLGWWGVEQLMEFGYFDRKPLSDARKFQVGSPAMMSYVGFLESLKVLLQIPNQNREKAALSVADYLRKRLSEIDIPYYDFGRDNNSATVSCKPPDVEKLNELLMKNRIYCSVRNGRLRVSPHFYNTSADVDRLLDHLR
ncbi:MAG: aminotransferase class V-fold PLP-dependent enzyme [Candidatus Thorarchaeota archaeon]|nr:aminotransferase class V-fold PLP-dependent enzyme [Candidatus Thorarchaeota archaeon]